MAQQIWLYWLLVGVMVIGIIGCIAPALPGLSLIAIAILIWGIVHGFSDVAVSLTVAIVLLLVGIAVDFLAGYWGAKQAGASNWGQIGAIVGLFVGLFGFLPALPVGGPIFGLLIGPVLGAVIGEFLYCRNLPQSARAALGIVVGTLVGRLIQFVLALICVGVFLWTTLPEVTGTNLAQWLPL
jgi:hypothetical protein